MRGCFSLGRGPEDRPCRRARRLPAPTVDARDQVCAETVPCGRCDGLCVARHVLDHMVRPSMRGQLEVGHGRAARPFMRGAARAFRSARGSVESAPRFGDSRRLPRPPMRPLPSRARLIMRTTPSPVQPRRSRGRDHLCGRSDTLRVTSTGSRQCGARPFMRSSDLALNCRLRPAADCPRTTGATAYAWITVRSDQRKRTARPFMRGQLAQQFADAQQTACPTQ